MKSYTIAAMFAAASVCAVAPANAATAEEYVAVAEELMAALNEMSDALNTVSDKATADAAAPKVAECIGKITTLKNKAADLGEATPEIQNQIREIKPELEQEMMGALMSFIGAIQNAANDEENPCYGSEDLIKALELMNAGEDEE